MEIKRIVTGVDADKKSIVSEETAVQPISAALIPGFDFYEVWATEGPIQLPVTAPARPSGTTFFPGPGETRFGLFILQPNRRDQAPQTARDEQTMAHGVEELNRKLPGLLEFMEPDHPGMHATRTIDYVVVVAGILTLELDDGAEVELTPGNCVVQNGTRHAWRNYGTQPVVVAYTLIAAQTCQP